MSRRKRKGRGEAGGEIGCRGGRGKEEDEKEPEYCLFMEFK